MQPAKPSFLEYFEQKEKENQINSFGQSVPGPLRNSSDWKVPQDGDYEFVSSSRRVCWGGLFAISHTHFCHFTKSASAFSCAVQGPGHAGSRSRAEGLVSLRRRFD